jgi:hypothetical protein
MELKNRTHGSKQFAEKTGMYRKIMPLKPLFISPQKYTSISIQKYTILI